MKGPLREFKSFAWIVILVFAFRSMFFEPFKIPSGSMIPTLKIGDFILVNKFAYGLRVPYTDWWFTDKSLYPFGHSTPERGDVIVFKYPRDKSLNYIKRVVALPGDTIEIVDKVVYINDEPVEGIEVDGKVFEEDMDREFQAWDYSFYKGKLGSTEHIYQLNNDAYNLANYSRRVVPDNHYFVMGDNRDHSADSRYWGFVPFDNVKGKAIMVWFSMALPFPWSEPIEEFTFRPWRIGTPII